MKKQEDKNLYVESSEMLNNNQKQIISRVYDLAFALGGTTIGMYGLTVRDEMWVILGLIALGGAMANEYMDYRTDIESFEEEKVKTKK